jgi:hypothetical protein
VWLIQLEVTVVSNACKLGEQIQTVARVELLSMTMNEHRESTRPEIRERGKKKSVADLAATSLFRILSNHIEIFNKGF